MGEIWFALVLGQVLKRGNSAQKSESGGKKYHIHTFGCQVLTPYPVAVTTIAPKIEIELC